MRAKIQRILKPAWCLVTVAAITIAATVILRPPTADAVPVQYVKICSLFGVGFLYLPNTDICVNFSDNDARELMPSYLVSELPDACSGSDTVLVSDATDAGCTAGNTPVGGGSNTCQVACVGGQWKFGSGTEETWRWRIPNNPRTWALSPQSACPGGQLVKFGDISGSDLALNSHGRFETTTHYPLNLKQGQYIASVMYKGGLTIPDYQVSNLPECPGSTGFTLVTDATDPYCTAGNAPVGGGTNTCEVACAGGQWKFTGHLSNTIGQGNFCMFYYYTDPTYGPIYSFPLGCIDTSPQATVPATLVFTPGSPIPPVVPYQTYILGASGDRWEVPSASDIEGMLSVWLCLQKAPSK